MEKIESRNYERMTISQLKEVYVERCRQINNYINKYSPSGRYRRQKVRKADKKDIPHSKDGLIIAIREIDIRLKVRELADLVDKEDTSKQPVLIIGGGK